MTRHVTKSATTRHTHARPSSHPPHIHPSPTLAHGISLVVCLLSRIALAHCAFAALHVGLIQSRIEFENKGEHFLRRAGLSSHTHPHHTTSHITLTHAQMSATTASVPSGPRRGGYRGRGGRNAGAAPANAAAPQADDTQEVRALRSKYGDKLGFLREMFAEWTDEDLLFALQDAGGEIELAVGRISEGESVVCAFILEPAVNLLIRSIYRPR